MLARWHDAELGWVSPADFIPVAEESGQIHALGDWAVRQAVAAVLALRAAGRWADGLRASVNVSMVQLTNPQLAERLIEAVTEAGGQPAWLELELTESVQLAEDPLVQSRMRRLREAGFNLAIDDFGAGWLLHRQADVAPAVVGLARALALASAPDRRCCKVPGAR